MTQKTQIFTNPKDAEASDDDSEILVFKTGPPTAKKRKVSYVYCD